MTSKLQCLLAALGAGLVGFVNWLATVPPEQQAGILATLVDTLPLEWRPAIGLWTRFAMVALGIYATYKAAHSSKETPLTK